MSEEQKAKLKEGKEKAQAERDAKFVSSEDFNSFKNSIVGILENISNTLATQATPERNVLMASAEPEKKPVFSNVPSNEPVVHNLGTISPDYEAIFEKYFDKEDGFIAMLRGVNFKIEVPKKFSNAQEAYWSLYKHDIRHKVLDGADIEGSMEKYCKQVALNLHYNKVIKLKI